MIGATVGSYRILRQIGEGGMGAVYLGEHAMLGRPAAIKILLPALSHNREMVGRFFNEARATTAIRHPGIVEIYDFGFLPDGAAFIAMEMLDGESLASRLRRVGKLPVGVAIELGRQTAAALHAAHSRGITHRDLKPDNMFLIRDPEIGQRVKLLDFGIAKLVSEEGGNRTRTGVVMGTPVYMSPEQCRGTASLDSRADLYSLGCVLYELVTGRPPFVAESAGDIIAHHLYFQPDPVRSHDPSVPAPLEQLIMALLAKDPAMRPGSAAEVSTILEGWRGLAPMAPDAGGRMPSGAPVAMAMPSAPPVAMASGMQSAPPVSATAPGPIVATHPTTLSGSAASVVATGLDVVPRRRWLASAAIGAVVVAAGAIAVVVATRKAEPTATVAAAAVDRAPAPPPATPPPVAPAPSIAAPAVAAPAVAPPAATPPPEPAPVETPSPAKRKPARVTTAAKPAKSHDAVAPAPREEPAIAAPPAPPVAPPELKPPPPEIAPKAEPKPAEPAAPAKPAASKWGHLMGDKSADANSATRFLFQKCKVAATAGDCVSARSIAASIAEKDIAMYRARVLTDPDIASCLSHK